MAENRHVRKRPEGARGIVKAFHFPIGWSLRSLRFRSGAARHPPSFTWVRSSLLVVAVVGATGALSAPALAQAPNGPLETATDYASAAPNPVPAPDPAPVPKPDPKPQPPAAPPPAPPPPQPPSPTPPPPPQAAVQRSAPQPIAPPPPPAIRAPKRVQPAALYAARRRATAKGSRAARPSSKVKSTRHVAQVARSTDGRAAAATMRKPESPRKVFGVRSVGLIALVLLNFAAALLLVAAAPIPSTSVGWPRVAVGLAAHRADLALIAFGAGAIALALLFLYGGAL